MLQQHGFGIFVLFIVIVHCSMVNVQCCYNIVVGLVLRCHRGIWFMTRNMSKLCFRCWLWARQRKGVSEKIRIVTYTPWFEKESLLTLTQTASRPSTPPLNSTQPLTPLLDSTRPMTHESATRSITTVNPVAVLTLNAKSAPGFDQLPAPLLASAQLPTPWLVCTELLDLSFTSPPTLSTLPLEPIQPTLTPEWAHQSSSPGHNTQPTS